VTPAIKKNEWPVLGATKKVEKCRILLLFVDLFIRASFNNAVGVETCHG